MMEEKSALKALLAAAFLHPRQTPSRVDVGHYLF